MAVLSILLAGTSLSACGGSQDAAPESSAEVMPADMEMDAPAVATVSIVEPADGAELPAGDVHVVLAANNIAILPAGDTTANSGHHHLLLNVATPAEGEPVPAGQPGYVHLGQAQTEYTFEDLAPGEYTLVAVLGDFAHRVLPQANDTTRFTVVAP